MDNLQPGLYENILTESLATSLESIDRDLVECLVIKSFEASDRFGLHLAELVRKALDGVPDSERVERGVEVALPFAGQLTERLALENDPIVTPGTVLSAYPPPTTSWHPPGTNELNLESLSRHNVADRERSGGEPSL